jgi:hypothetical protein
MAGGGPESEWTGTPVDGAAGIPNIKVKFGVTLDGKEGVDAAFNELSAYIKNGGLASADTVIQPGDWIDLKNGLSVDDYPGSDGAGGGGFSFTAEEAGVEIVDTYGALEGGEAWPGRLIVVGINSFRSGNGTDGKYSVIANDGVDHVVFQFQAVPVKRRMNLDAANTGGYAASEMRKYLTGNFLAGLENAGVPLGVLWAPARSISSSTDSVEEIRDLLWLPTIWEIVGSQYNWAVPSESAENQARLEYYGTNIKRYKLDSSTELCGYWASSMDSSYGFCRSSNDGWPSFLKADQIYGVVPAFCVY